MSRNIFLFIADQRQLLCHSGPEGFHTQGHGRGPLPWWRGLSWGLPWGLPWGVPWGCLKGHCLRGICQYGLCLLPTGGRCDVFDSSGPTGNQLAAFEQFCDAFAAFELGHILVEQTPQTPAHTVRPFGQKRTGGRALARASPGRHTRRLCSGKVTWGIGFEKLFTDQCHGFGPLEMTLQPR